MFLVYLLNILLSLFAGTSANGIGVIKIDANLFKFFVVAAAMILHFFRYCLAII